MHGNFRHSEQFYRNGVVINKKWRVYKINPRNLVLGKYKLNSLTDPFTPKNYVASSQTFTIATDSSLVYKSEMRTVDDREEFQVMINIEDIKNRIKLMPDPEKAIVKRLLLELEGTEKHNLFIK